MPADPLRRSDVLCARVITPGNCYYRRYEFQGWNIVLLTRGYHRNTNPRVDTRVVKSPG